MLTKKTIGFLGAGNLAEALIKGLLAAKKVTAGQLVASDKISERLVHLVETYEIKVYNKNYEVIKNSDIIFITVKPNDVRGVIKEIAPDLRKGKVLISAAAGITTSAILESLREGGLASLIPVIRAMPNTPVIVQEGAIALYAGIGARQPDLKLAKAVFESVGKVTILEDESLMDAVTGLSGSGPAYVFLFMEALIEAGMKAGLPEDSAKTLAVQTTLGAARLAAESPKKIAELREMVTSPGGTTVEGLKKLYEGGFRDVIIGAVEAAAKKSRQLSGEGK